MCFGLDDVSIARFSQKQAITQKFWLNWKNYKFYPKRHCFVLVLLIIGNSHTFFVYLFLLEAQVPVIDHPCVIFLLKIVVSHSREPLLDNKNNCASCEISVLFNLARYLQSKQQSILYWFLVWKSTVTMIGDSCRKVKLFLPVSVFIYLSEIRTLSCHTYLKVSFYNICTVLTTHYLPTL